MPSNKLMNRPATARRTVTIGFVFGCVLGGVATATGLLRALSLFGVWEGGMWLAFGLAPLALFFAARWQKAGGEALGFALGFAVGVLPGALYLTRGLPAYELGFPMGMSVLCGLILAPLIVAIRRQLS